MSQDKFRQKDGVDYIRVTSVTNLIAKWLTQWSADSAVDSIIAGLPGLKDIEDQAEKTKKFNALLKAARYRYIEIGDIAKQVGTDVHEAVEVWLKQGKEVHLRSTEARNAFNGFLTLEKELKDKRGLVWLLDECEETLFNNEELYCGKPDLLAMLDDDKWLLDTKTMVRKKDKKGKFTWPNYIDWKIQLSGYRKMIPDVVKMGIIRLDKTSEVANILDCSKHYDKCYKMFYHYLQIALL